MKTDNLDPDTPGRRKGFCCYENMIELINRITKELLDAKALYYPFKKQYVGAWTVVWLEIIRDSLLFNHFN